MEPISATLITLNEEDNIAGALESLRWVEEIVVVDSGSADGTLDVCRRYTDRIYHRDWTGFVDQKNYAVAKAGHDWILSLDADERVDAPLRDEIQGLRRRGFSCAGFRVPRVACFMGRWIRHGDWYPDPQLRLFDRKRGRWRGGRLHESVRVDGPVGILNGEILHFTYRSLADYLERLNTYSGLAAADYHERGERAAAWKLLLHPPVAFLRGYLMKRGFLDGVPGFMAAVMGAVSVYFKHARLYELQKYGGKECGDGRL